MTEDLEPFLQRWPMETGTVQVRTITGLDGRTKIQLRLDLGVMQMEQEGRPDGQRPFGCETLLEHFRHVAEKAEGEECDASFHLTSEDCLKLQHEALQFYHRCMALAQLEEWEGIIRDSTVILELLDFVDEHLDREELKPSYQQFRPCVMLIQTRARTMIWLRDNHFPKALKEIESGIHRMEDFLGEHLAPEMIEQNSELQYLRQWSKRVQEERPLTPREKLHQQMLEAIRREDYERAARLRDALREIGGEPSEPK